MINKLFKFLSIIQITFFLGCAVGPDYVRPEIEMPQTWRVNLAKSESIANILWWQEFQDPQLNELIEISLQNNLNLLSATAQVEEFYARYGIARSDFFPEIGADGSYNRQKQSQNNIFSSTLPGSSSLFGTPRNFYSTALSLTWELDIWGKIRRSTEAAQADLLSQEAARRGVVLTLVSTVASTYVTLRNLDRQLEITQETLRTREKSFGIIDQRFKGGIIPELDVKQAQSEVLSAQAAIPLIQQAIFNTENALCVLLGRTPGDVKRGQSLRELLNARKVPSGIPSDILLQRPDVVQAEEALQAANARIGVARAAYFPSLSLTGAYGFQSIESSNWLKEPSRAWNYGPSINLPIFTAGRIGDQVEVAKAQQEQALNGYKNSILNALSEINNSLYSYEQQTSRVSLLGQQVGVLKDYLDLANLRYEQGQTGYLEVLDAERRYFEAQLTESSAQNQLIQSYIDIYRASGGGWVAEANNFTAQPEDHVSLF